MIEIGSSIIGIGESSGSSIQPAWFALAITWLNAQGNGGRHD
ncbi:MULTISPECIES: hypothetical protein [Aeromonas]|nr:MULTISPECIES: hypothetical protein [Aeromonas]